MAKPMAGPGGKPMMGQGGKPLGCEPAESCCEGTPPPCAITCNWHWDVISSSPPPCLIALVDDSFTTNGANIVSWEWQRSDAPTGPWTTFATTQDTTRQGQLPGAVEWIKLIVTDENDCVAEKIDAISCPAVGCCAVATPVRAFLQYPNVVKPADPDFGQPAITYLIAGDALCTTLLGSVGDYYSPYIFRTQPGGFYDGYFFFRVRICTSGGSFETSTGGWTIDMYYAPPAPGGGPPTSLQVAFVNEANRVCTWRSTGPNYLGLDCRNIAPAVIPFLETTISGGVDSNTGPCTVSPSP